MDENDQVLSMDEEKVHLNSFLIKYLRISWMWSFLWYSSHSKIMLCSNIYLLCKPFLLIVALSDFCYALQLSHFKKAIEDMAARSLRCVAIAYRSYQIEDVPSDEEELNHWELPEEELVLLAIVGIKVTSKLIGRDLVGCEFPLQMPKNTSTMRITMDHHRIRSTINSSTPILILNQLGMLGILKE